MSSEIGHQIGRYRKTEALKTKINTLRPGGPIALILYEEWASRFKSTTFPSWT